MFKLFVEFGPIIVFFATYKFSNMIVAAALMMAVTVLGLIIIYWIEKKISIPLMISGIILLIMGGITVLTGDSKFFKMKPTIVYLIFSGILIYGALRKQGYIKFIFGSVLNVHDHAWVTLSLRFALYFLIMAFLNEYVWRHYSDEFWVSFKVFGFAPITFIFVLFQVPFLLKNQTKGPN
jgi:intracellular septation protein